MTALFLTVLFASLVGSLHCAGMCGAFVAFAIGAGEPGVKTSRSTLLSLYQAGRLITYTILGTAAGALGETVDLGGKLVGIQRTAAILSGLLMVVFATITLLRLSGFKFKHLRAPASWNNTVSAAHRRSMRYSPPTRALATGLLTTLIPCGWLYAFVITAAGTGHAWSGALLMATFWLGTLPMLTIVGVGVRKLSGAFAAKIPAVSATLVLAVGLYTIAARAGVTLKSPPASPPATTTDLISQIKSIDQKKLPCCSEPAPTAPGERNP